MMVQPACADEDTEQDWDSELAKLEAALTSVAINPKATSKVPLIAYLDISHVCSLKSETVAALRAVTVYVIESPVSYLRDCVMAHAFEEAFMELIYVPPPSVPLK